jgi:hypothetical protein
MSSAKAIANARNGRKSNGAKTAAGKLTIARANTTNGIRSNLPVLEGIEDLAECERFHQGFVAARFAGGRKDVPERGRVLWAHRLVVVVP